MKQLLTLAALTAGVAACAPAHTPHHGHAHGDVHMHKDAKHDAKGPYEADDYSDPKTHYNKYGERTRSYEGDEGDVYVYRDGRYVIYDRDGERPDSDYTWNRDCAPGRVSKDNC